MEAIDRIRSIVNWANDQSEFFNEKIKSIGDFEKLYDYSQENNLGYLDESWNWDDDITYHIKAITKLLGYNVF